VGSQQPDPSRWEPSIASAAKVFADLKLVGIDLTMLNIGGGFPVQYVETVPSISQYGEAIGIAIDRWFGTTDRPTIMSEPGRYIAAEAGVLRTRIVSARDPIDGGDRWIYLDAGRFGGLAETEGEAICYQLATSHSGPVGPVVLAGPTCDSVDILYRKKKYALPLALDIGDTVDFLSAGAYTASYSSSGFNGFPPLRTYVLSGESDS